MGLPLGVALMLLASLFYAIAGYGRESDERLLKTRTRLLLYSGAAG